MIELAVREHDFEAAHSLFDRRPPFTDSARHERFTRIFDAYALPDSNRMARTLEVAREASPYVATYAGIGVAQLLGAPADGERIALAAGEPQAPATLQALAAIHAARGRWSAVRERLAAAEAAGQEGIDPFTARCATLFFLPVPEPELRRIRDRVAGWDSVAPAGAREPEMLMRPHAREYVLGLISVRLGEYEQAERHAAALDAMSAPPALEPTARLLARSVRAHGAWRRDRPERALELLGDVASGAHVALLQSPFLGRDRERFLRAALLQRLGRGDEALPWLEHGIVGPNEIFYIAPARLRRAQIHDARGERDRARRHYAAFIEAWADADPPAASRVEAARRRLAELTGEGD